MRPDLPDVDFDCDEVTGDVSTNASWTWTRRLPARQREDLLFRDAGALSSFGFHAAYLQAGADPERVDLLDYTPRAASNN
jgi:hypothetical protein